jgi:hypothetical protein
VKVFLASRIDRELKDYLASLGESDFQVHSVFRNSINLLTPSRMLITLAGPGSDLMPMGMLIQGFSELVLAGKNRVRLAGTFLHLPENQGLIDAGQAEVWPTNLESPLNPNRKEMGLALDYIENKLLQEEREGIASLAAVLAAKRRGGRTPSLNMYASFILEDLSLFLDAYGEGRLERAGQLARALIGFGPGLTPSCDDFMTALLLSLFYRTGDSLSRDLTAAFFETVVSLAKEKTNLISCQMIRQAARGHAGRLYLDTFAATVRGDLAALEPLVERLLVYGASSGADFLFGLYCALSRMPAVSTPVGAEPLRFEAGRGQNDLLKKNTG